MLDYKKIIIIDSVVTGKYKTGTVFLYSKEEIKTQAANFNLHGMNIAEVFSISERMGLGLPDEIYLIGIEVQKIAEFGAEPDEDLQSKISSIYNKVEEIIRELI